MASLPQEVCMVIAAPPAILSAQRESPNGDLLRRPTGALNAGPHASSVETKATCGAFVNGKRDTSCVSNGSLRKQSRALGPKARKALRLSSRLSRQPSTKSSRSCSSRSSSSSSSSSGLNGRLPRVESYSGLSRVRRATSWAQPLVCLPSTLCTGIRSKSRLSEEAALWAARLREELRGLAAAVAALRDKQNNAAEAKRAAIRQVVRAETETLRRRVCLTVARSARELHERHTELESRLAAVASLVVPSHPEPVSLLLPTSRGHQRRLARQRALSNFVMKKGAPLLKRESLSLRGCWEPAGAAAPPRRAESCTPAAGYRHCTLPEVAQGLLLLQRQQEEALLRLSEAEAVQHRLQRKQGEAAAFAAKSDEQKMLLQKLQQQVRGVEEQAQQATLQVEQLREEWQQHERLHAASEGSTQRDITALLARQQQLLLGEKELQQLLQAHGERQQAYEEALEQLRAAQGHLQAAMPHGLGDRLAKLQELVVVCSTAQRQAAATAAVVTRTADRHAALEAQVMELAAAGQAAAERQGAEGLQHREAQQVLQQQIGLLRTSLHGLSGELGCLRALACETQARLNKQQLTQQHQQQLQQQRQGQLQELQRAHLQLEQRLSAATKKFCLRGSAAAGLAEAGRRGPSGCFWTPCSCAAGEGRLQQQTAHCQAYPSEAARASESLGAAISSASTEAWGGQGHVGDADAHLQKTCSIPRRLALLQQQVARTSLLLNTTVRDQALLIEALASEQQNARWSWQGFLPANPRDAQTHRRGGPAANWQGSLLRANPSQKTTTRETRTPKAALPQADLQWQETAEAEAMAEENANPQRPSSPKAGGRASNRPREPH